MDAAPAKPAAQAPAPAPTPVADTRAPATGTIRIPGMDQPAPVSTSAPVGKFDFGKPVAAAALRQEPLSTLSERLAAQNPSATPAAPRIPSSLTPVSENRSFAEGPALSVAKPAPTSPAASSGDFSFDFGFAQIRRIPAQRRSRCHSRRPRRRCIRTIRSPT
jgi:translation initiation factor IF-2